MSNTSNKKSALPSAVKWSQLDWKPIQGYVEKLQQRIYRAESLGQKRKVRNLQRLLMHSMATLLISIKRVTQTNKGKKTPGIDGVIALTEEERMALFERLKVLQIQRHNPKPAYRVYIKKKNGKLRPLSIPTIQDRIYQNIAKTALEPQWEARFEPTTYGFRPKRSCHDAIERIFKSCVHGKKQWIFEGDFKGCFDNLSHEHIMEMIRDFPHKEVIGKWLKSGYVDNNVFLETEAGSGQGSIISPLLANIALHGMEDALGIQYKSWLRSDGYKIVVNKTKYSLSKYADDFVIMCETRKDATGIYDILKPYLIKRGLELALDKTNVIPITEGFDFLGFNVRRYKTTQKDKLLIKPSRESVKKTKRQISEKIRALNGNSVGKVIETLNPIILGKANYWSPEVSKKTYQNIDNHIYWCTYKFLRRLHRNKSSKWIKAQYYKTDRTGQSKRNYILTDPVKGSQLKIMAWTPIVRHTLISHKASPYDMTLKEYYQNRDLKEFIRNNVASRQKLAKQQGYKCPLCGTSVTSTEEKLKVKQKIPTVHGGTQQYKNLQLVHQNCNTEYYKRFPEKGTLPNQKQINKCCKIIKDMKLAASI